MIIQCNGDLWNYMLFHSFFTTYSGIFIYWWVWDTKSISYISLYYIICIIMYTMYSIYYIYYYKKIEKKIFNVPYISPIMVFRTHHIFVKKKFLYILIHFSEYDILIFSVSKHIPRNTCTFYRFLNYSYC